MSTTSFKIMPQQSYFVFYEAQTEATPAWFVVYAAFSGFPFRTEQGMNIRLELPHTVYLLPKKSLAKADVVVEKVDFKPADKKLLISVYNQGETFGRVQETTIRYGNKKQDGPGFPIFPHRKRILEVPLQEQETPTGVVLQFQDFKIEEKVESTPQQ